MNWLMGLLLDFVKSVRMKLVYQFDWDGSPAATDYYSFGDPVLGNSGITGDNETFIARRTRGSGLELSISRSGDGSTPASVGSFVPNPANAAGIIFERDRTYWLEGTFINPTGPHTLTSDSSITAVWVVGVHAREGGDAVLDLGTKKRLAATVVFKQTSTASVVNLNLPDTNKGFVQPGITTFQPTKQIPGITYDTLNVAPIPFTVRLEFNLSDRYVKASFSYNGTSFERSEEILENGPLDNVIFDIAGVNLTVDKGIDPSSVVCKEFKIYESRF